MIKRDDDQNWMKEGEAQNSEVVECDVVQTESMAPTHWTASMEGIQPKGRHPGFLEWET